MSIYQGQTLIAGGSNTFPLLSFHLTDHILNDISWLRSDTFSWQSGDVYTAAYNHLYNDLQEATLVNGDYKNSNIKNVGLIDNKGVLRGFNTTTNYATFKVKTPKRNLELVMDLVTPTTYANASSFLQASQNYKGVICRLTTAGVLNMWMSSNGTSWNVMSNWATGITIPANTKAKFKLTWDGEVYSTFYSLDIGNSWIAGNTLSSTLPIFWDTGEQGIGGCTWESYAFTNGIINLPGCYAIIDDETYWQGLSYNLDYYLAKDNHKIVLAEKENEVIEEYNRKGIAWYFIIDVDNNRFKLPRENYAKKLLESKHDSLDWDNKISWTASSVAPCAGVVLCGGTGSDRQVYLDFRPKGDSTTYSINCGYNNDAGLSGTFVLNEGDMAWTSNGCSGYFIPFKDNNVYNSSLGLKRFLYFYMGNYMQTAIQQTAGLNTELFNGKLDIDSPIAQAPYIVESFRDGNNWYRIWSDGWCEQGGIYIGTFTRTSIFNLLKEYIDTDYTIIGNTLRNGYESCAWVVDSTTKGTISFQGESFRGTSANISYTHLFWTAKGYIF